MMYTNIGIGFCVWAAWIFYSILTFFVNISVHFIKETSEKYRQFFSDKVNWNVYETLEPNRIFVRLKFGNQSQNQRCDYRNDSKLN